MRSFGSEGEGLRFGCGFGGGVGIGAGEGVVLIPGGAVEVVRAEEGSVDEPGEI